jgi:hypothetical protein
VGWNLRLRTRRSHTSTRNAENTASLYWSGPPESKTLRPVLRLVLLETAYEYKGRLVRLILATVEVGFQTPSRLRPGDLSLHYTSCHISSICLVEIHRCLVLYAKTCGRAELGRLGNLLEGLQEVMWAAN